MNRLRSAWPVIRRVWAITGVSVTVIFVAWSAVAFRASDEAVNAARSDGVVVVDHAAGVWRFEPAMPGAAPRTGMDSMAGEASVAGAPPPPATLVFFAGALVDPRAYAPLARAVAAQGHRVMLVELPRRGVFGGADSPELAARIRRVLDGVDGPVVLGGHSRGGGVVARVAAEPDFRISGLLFIGTSHPRRHDLGALDLPVTKVVGTRDGHATPARVMRNAGLLPPQTRWVWVEGGNHSQFGWYGFQPMDRRPRISAPDQRQIMIDAALDLLKLVSVAPVAPALHASSPPPTRHFSANTAPSPPPGSCGCPRRAASCT